ncbi:MULTISPECIES: S24 family peptidase [Serratia]|nr:MULTISPECIES: S24 family peptidase [Serratia]MBN5205204.1 helix-turn-helix domain-containing protein [Serratia marcescens]REF42112.1 helix-turn-helix protein [Serratia ficaria]CAI1047157.1 LexA repressor [Serratia ficaria]CAI1103987.1 LexA repressor [Serratia ficaria]CAI1173729.1 LexA repressor [Serratia ficaria]
MKKKSLTDEQIADAGRLKSLYNSKKKELNLSQQSLAETLGVSQSAVAMLLNGVNALNHTNAASLAKMFGVRIEDISPKIAEEIADMASALGTLDVEYAGKVKEGLIPVVGEAVLGMDGAVDMIEFRAGWLKIYSGDRDAYALKVKGDSMWPRIQSGEFVVIEPNTSVHPGDEVFVRTKDGHNMIKIFNKTRDGDYQLSSVNNDHRPITLAPADIDKLHFVSAIVKATRYTDIDETN